MAPLSNLVLEEDDGLHPGRANSDGLESYEDQSNVSQNSSAEFVPLMTTMGGSSAVLGKAVTPVLGSSSADSVEVDDIAASGTKTPPTPPVTLLLRTQSRRERDVQLVPPQRAGAASLRHRRPCLKLMTCKQLLLSCLSTRQAVVAHAESPDQKREMVDLIKRSAPDREHSHFFIGDGANDVPMIQGRTSEWAFVAKRASRR